MSHIDPPIDERATRDAAPRPVPAPVRADRAAGVLLASAAGDALGAGYEFGPPLDEATAVEMRGGGAFGWEPSEWTDDTQMALAVLTPLAEGDPDPLPAVEDGFRAWFASGPADVGGQTADALGSTGPLAEAARRTAAADPQRAGNGSLMRTGPVALAHPGDPEAIAALAREVSSLTHATDDCVDACILWSVAIDHAIHHAPPSDEWFDWASGLRAALRWLPEERRGRWRQLIEDAADGTALEFPKNGWVVHAFQAALAAICSTPVEPGPLACAHLQAALEEAVRAGGDTDTVAAIAGALLGARWGATAVPFAWRRCVHGRRTYGAPPLRAADLERLARLAVRGGAHRRPGLAGSREPAAPLRRGVAGRASTGRHRWRRLRKRRRPSRCTRQRRRPGRVTLPHGHRRRPGRHRAPRDRAARLLCGREPQRSLRPRRHRNVPLRCGHGPAADLRPLRPGREPHARPGHRLPAADGYSPDEAIRQVSEALRTPKAFLVDAALEPRGMPGAAL